MTSPIVIIVPTRALMVGETKGSFVHWLANLNIKRNLTSMFFVNKYLPYMTLNVAFKLESCTSCVDHCLQAGISRFYVIFKEAGSSLHWFCDQWQ